jgi:hypothetical protein
MITVGSNKRVFLGLLSLLENSKKSVEDPKDCESLNHKRLDWT